jgi:CRP-like cAMP-binding protein
MKMKLFSYSLFLSDNSENLSLSAEERYHNFLAKYPQFVDRVPLKQIASYLGVTPEFLSVIRKKGLKDSP